MDEYIIESHFTKIGHSFYRSDQFLKNSHNFEPVGELGIGVLSYFMIADKVTIETTTGIDNSLIIEIDNVSDYFFVKRGVKRSPGTIVTLDLNKDFEYKSLARLIRAYATHIEFPIEIFDSDGEKYIVENGINFPSELSEKHHEVIVLPVENECFSGSFGVFVNKNIGNPFEIDSIKIYQGKKRKQKCVSSEGIFVSNGYVNDLLLPAWINPDLVDFDINLKKRVIDLNVARNNIVDNEKLAKFRDMFEEELINALIILINETKAKSHAKNKNVPNLIYNLFKNYIRNKLNICVFNKEHDSVLSEKFIKFLKQFCIFKCFTYEGIFYLNYEDVIRKNEGIILLNNLNDKDDDYLLSILENSYIKSMIIADEKDKSIIYVSEILFNIQPREFIEIFGVRPIRSTKLDSIFSELNDSMGIGYVLYRTVSYITTRFVEYANEEDVIFNEDNNFIKLIMTNENSLADETTTFSLRDFFSSLMINRNYNCILFKQKAILRLFVDRNIIAENDATNYELKPSDFPPSFFNKSF